MAVMVPLFAVVAYAAAGGNAANAHKCEEGGYLDYTDANGDPFKNEGQCTSYAARGGQLVPVPTGPDITIDQAAGTISGTGFTPNSSSFFVTTAFSPSGLTVFGLNPVTTDATGAFVSSGWNFCLGEGDTSANVTVSNRALAVRVTETFPIECSR
jgi:hypothetical protein